MLQSLFHPFNGELPRMSSTTYPPISFAPLIPPLRSVVPPRCFILPFRCILLGGSAGRWFSLVLLAGGQHLSVPTLAQSNPSISSVTQNGPLVTIQGNGFSPNFGSNIVSIGEGGWCTVQSASGTSIVCAILNAPSGRQLLQLNIADKGRPSANGNFFVNVPLSISSFTPNGGDAGGGDTLTVLGEGFSSNALITLGEHFCLNQTVLSFTSIRCVVPPSSSATFNQVRVTGTDGSNSATASTLFTYNTTTLPTISSISPTFVTSSGGVIAINGTGFGPQGLSVLIDTKNARVLFASNNEILINVTALAPGLYPLRVRTSSGFARPLFYLECRFYVQEISPQLGSAYGGNEISLNGVGFENGTRVQLRNRENQTAPCNIISIQSTQIQCQTTKITQQVNITSFGTHPTYGFGYSWFPIRQTVEQGTLVQWSWDSSQLLTPVTYQLQQVDSAYGNTPTPSGFDSGSPTSAGSFSHQFDVLGTFYYWAPNVQPSSGYSMRGAIDVVPLESQTITVEAIWNKFTGQSLLAIDEEQIETFLFLVQLKGVPFPSFSTPSTTRPVPRRTILNRGAHPTLFTPVNDSTALLPVCPFFFFFFFDSFARCLLVPIPSSSCSSIPLNGSACAQPCPRQLIRRTTFPPRVRWNRLSVPHRRKDRWELFSSSQVRFFFFFFRVSSSDLLEIIPGRNFGGNLCDYDIQIGSSYHCPVTNLSSTELRCQITGQSLLDPNVNNAVRVARHQQGFLATENQLRFRLLPSISQITPISGKLSQRTGKSTSLSLV